MFNIERLEFIVTKKCTGRCKHCSVIGTDRNPDNSYEDFEKVMLATTFLLNNFNITSIMTFGGEPLLYSEITAQIHRLAKENGVKKRELITSGYFSKDEETISSVVRKTIESGVSRILLSMDAFHQEQIPQGYVEVFIRNAISLEFKNIKVHPAWVVSQEFDNEYNERTKGIIAEITSKYGIQVSKGNNIVLSGSSRENLKRFYKREKIDLSKRCGEIPYTNSLDNVKNIRILPNGNINICRGLAIGNIYHDDIGSILKKYNPRKDLVMSTLLENGIMGVHQLAERKGRKIAVNEYYSSCDLCADCIKAIDFR